MSLIIYKPICRSRIPEYSQLLNDSFRSHRFSIRYLMWQYFENPVGNAIGYDALFNDKVIAHYVCLPIQIGFGAQKSLLSLNTATAAQFRGRGLFSNLANLTFETAKSSYAQVVGVANANSIDGFTRKLNFQQLGNLDLSFGQIMVIPDRLNSCRYSEELISWRIKSPLGSFHLKSMGDYSLVTRRINPFLALKQFVATQSSNNTGVSRFKSLKRTPVYGLRLDWNRGVSHRGFTKLPRILKPSPLHLISRKFESDVKELEYFSFLDFDAF